MEMVQRREREMEETSSGVTRFDDERDLPFRRKARLLQHGFNFWQT